MNSREVFWQIIGGTLTVLVGAGDIAASVYRAEHPDHHLWLSYPVICGAVGAWAITFGIGRLRRVWARLGTSETETP